jgi:hypothetical protein
MDARHADRTFAGGRRLSETSTKSDPASTSNEADEGKPQFRRTLVRVLIVQVVTLVLLWLIQTHFSPR